MSSKPYKIFGPHTGRGIEPITGRNAQFPIMSKKQEYGDGALSERPYISPFSGYTSTSQNNLSLSQATEFNPDFTRKIVKEQLEKQIKEEPVQNDISILKAEMRSLKEFVEGVRGRLQKQGQDDRQELRTEMKGEMSQVLEEYRVQTARNLREVLKKFDQNIKKQIFVQFGSKYLPLSFVDDMDKQFNELEDRIQIVETKVTGSKNRASEDPIVIAQTFQLRLKKTERQLQYFKKTISQTQSLFQNLQAQTTELKSRQQTNEEKMTYLQDDFGKFRQQMDKETKKLFQTFEENNKLLNSIWDDKLKGISEELNNKISATSSSDVREFLHNSNNLAVSAMFDSTLKHKSSSDREVQKGVVPLFRPPSVPKQSQNEHNEKEKEKHKKDKEKDKMMYLIDKQNFLMDEEGNYITDAGGNQIKLSGDQLSMLRNSNLVKMVQQ